MTENGKLLSFVYKNAEMGRQTLPKLIELTEDEKLRASLENQLGEYEEISAEAKKMLRSDRSIDEEELETVGLSGFEKLTTDMMLRLNTVSDHSTAHFADMLLKGSSMGITDISKQLERYPGAGEGAVGLAHKLLRSEENNIDEMKKYLTCVEA